MKNKKYTADELIYQVYREICATGDITLETSMKITEYIMEKHGK
jgi:hypothetical protein